MYINVSFCVLSEINVIQAACSTIVERFNIGLTVSLAEIMTTWYLV